MFDKLVFSASQENIYQLLKEDFFFHQKLVDDFVVTPGQECLTMVQGENKNLFTMTWGMTKTILNNSVKISHIDIHTLDQTRTYQEAISKNRCLILTKALYKGRNSFMLGEEEELMFLCGIWSRSKTGQAECAILTRMKKGEKEVIKLQDADQRTKWLNHDPAGPTKPRVIREMLNA